MILNLLTLIAVAVVVIGFVRKVMALVAPDRGRPAATDLVRCARCGAWHDPAAPCGHLPPGT